MRALGWSYTFPRFRNVSLSSLRVASLLSALFLYAAFGSPTPDSPGWLEAVVAILLVFSVGASGAYEAVAGRGRKPMWFFAGRAFLIFGLFIPLVVAALRGNPEALILRDVIPFLFMLLPVFLYGLITVKAYYVPYLAVATIIVGLLFSVRSLAEIMPFVTWNERFYFANAPTVLFSAMVLVGLVGKNLTGGVSLKRVFLVILCMGLAALPLSAMALTAQRASLGAVVAYALILCAAVLYKKPERCIVLFVALGGALFLVWPVVAELWDALAHKTEAVGMNMRLQEATAVWRAVTAQPGTLLFGLGWGGTFESPAVGGVSVNFSHGLVTSMFLKTGLCGVILTFIYMAALVECLIRLVFRDPMAGLALAAPVFIDVLFYASFKSLDFGLVLLLIPSLLSHARRSAGFGIGMEGKDINL